MEMNKRRRMTAAEAAVKTATAKQRIESESKKHAENFLNNLDVLLNARIAEGHTSFDNCAWEIGDFDSDTPGIDIDQIGDLVVQDLIQRGYTASHEYDGECWGLRVSWHNSSQSTAATAATAKAPAQ